MNIICRAIAGLVLLICATAAQGAIRVTAKADPATLPVGGNLRIEYTVNTDRAPKIQSPAFKGFDVLVGPSVSTFSNYQMVNGRSSSSASTTYTYILSPQAEGSYTIPPATITVDGHAYRSPALRVRVTKGGAPQSASGGRTAQGPAVKTSGRIGQGDLFIRVSANKKQVYEQEPILLTYKVYSLVNLTQLNAKMPDLKGFLTQEVALPQQKTLVPERLGGKLYQAATWSQYVMFPQQTGRLQIPSIPFEGIVTQYDESIDPIDAFFNGGANAFNVKVVRHTEPITITVLPLPKPQPANFSGGVGSLTITAQTLTPHPATNDAATLRVVVSGVGNMKLIQTPTVKFPPSFDTYDAKVTDETRLATDGVQGRMVFDYLAVPKAKGQFTIPPVELVYFDVNAHAYRTVRTEPIRLDVRQGSRTPNAAQETLLKRRDINNIVSSSATGASRLTWSAWPFALLNVLLLGLAYAAALWLRRRQKERGDVVGRQARWAGRVARQRLKAAQACLEAHRDADFYDKLARALTGYVADRLHLPAGEWGQEQLGDRLAKVGIVAEHVGNYLALLDTCNRARFAPAGQEEAPTQLFSQAQQVIETLEADFKKTKP